MSKTSTKKPAPPPSPTILVLTLQTDGTGTLLTRRGELASLSSFTFQNMAGIVSAIEHGAAHLLDVEKNPPPKDVPHTAASSSPTPPAPIETPESPAADPSEPAQETVLDDTIPPTVEGSAALDAPAAALPLPLNLNGPLAGIIPETAQLNLF